MRKCVRTQRVWSDNSLLKGPDIWFMDPINQLSKSQEYRGCDPGKVCGGFSCLTAQTPVIFTWRLINFWEFYTSKNTVTLCWEGWRDEYLGETEIHRGMPREDRGRYWSNAFTSQGKSRTAQTTRSQEEARKGPPLGPGWHLDFRHPASTVRENTFLLFSATWLVVLGYSSSRKWIQEAWKIDTS